VSCALALCAEGSHLGGLIGFAVFALFYGRIYQVVSLQKSAFLQVYANRKGWTEGSVYAQSRAARGS